MSQSILEIIGEKTFIFAHVSKYIKTNKSPSLKIVDITNPEDVLVVTSLK